MTKKEFDAMVKEMHRQGLSDDDVMQVLYEAFMTHKCSLEDYEVMVNWLGYTITDDFYKDHNIKKKK